MDKNPVEIFLFIIANLHILYIFIMLKVLLTCNFSYKKGVNTNELFVLPDNFLPLTYVTVWL